MNNMRSRQTPWAVCGHYLRSALCALAVLSLAACGSSGSSASNPTASSMSQSACSGCGTAMVSMTDAPGDFVSYMVKVDSLTLTRSDGTVVQTVPITSQVDFAQLVNLSEIMSAQQIPAGRYETATLTLDYSSATLVVDTANGNETVPVADIIDGSTGKPVSGPVTVTLSLSSGNQLVVAPGAVANLAREFNLAASNTVDLTANPLTVTVNPVLTASLAPDLTKQIHVRGPLVSVSTSGSDYVVNVRPFNDPEDSFGQLTVNTTASTT